MIITRRNPFTGRENSRDLPVTDEQLAAYYQQGRLLQEAFSNLSADDREFIKSGIDNWDELFGESQFDSETE